MRVTFDRGVHSRWLLVEIEFNTFEILIQKRYVVNNIPLDKNAWFCILALLCFNDREIGGQKLFGNQKKLIHLISYGERFKFQLYKVVLSMMRRLTRHLEI